MKQLRPRQETAIATLRASLGKGNKRVEIDGKQWALVEESPRYWVSEYGDVISTIRAGRVMSQTIGHHGYAYVSLMIDNKPVKKTVHRLVASCFVDGDGETVNHIDGDKLNNKFSNLEWCTYSENNNHARDLGLAKSFGESHYASKLKNSDVLEIREMLKRGFLHKDVAAQFGVVRQQITKIANNAAWRRT
jgi:hypothetical protein